MKKLKLNMILSLILIIVFLLGACGKKNNRYTIIDDNYRNYYQIFPYSFADSDGDGIGDIKGITQQLDYLSDLGVNGVWLTPIMPSNSYHKYDVNDYYEIDPEFGTLTDFKELIDEAHKRGIRIIIDLVFNHTSTSHPWFVESTDYLKKLGDKEASSDECPYLEYYNFTKEDNKGDTYHPIKGSDWYYEGVFWGGMPDLNLSSNKLRKEIEDIAKFWLDLGVDGFRLDAAKEFYSGEKERNIEVLNWFSEYVKSIKKDAYLVAEVWDTDAALTQYYKSGILSLFNFPLSQHTGIIIKAVKQLDNMDAATYIKEILKLEESYKSANPDYIDSPFISNHDTTRISAQCIYNEDQMKMAAGLLLTMKGSPFIYYGEEIGMSSLGSKDENKRLPMRWSDTDSKYMTKGPIDADDVDHEFSGVDEQLKDPLSILNYYKKGLKLRNKYGEIARGETSLIEDLSTASVAVIRKNYEEEDLLIVYNISADQAEIKLPEGEYKDYKIVDYLTVDNQKVDLVKGKMILPKYSIILLK